MQKSKSIKKLESYVNNSINQLTLQAGEFLKSGRLAPKYLRSVDVIKDLKTLKSFPWQLDEQIIGIKDAGFGFVISNPQLTDYIHLNPWKVYMEDGVVGNRTIMILGGGDASKEIGLLNQFAAKKRVIANSRFLLTDLHKPKQEVLKAKWKNIPNITTGSLNLMDFDKVYKLIKSYKPDTITLLSILSVFPTNVQERLLQIIYQSLPPGGKIFLGTALPATPTNFYGYPITVKAEKFIRSAQDFLAATLMTLKEQESLPFLFEPHKLGWSKKAFKDFAGMTSFNSEWSLYLTAQLQRLERIGFEIQIINLKGVEGKIGSNRPCSLPPYMTAYCEKPKSIDMQLVKTLKTTVVDGGSEVRLIPFDGSEIVNYYHWFDRASHSEEMKYEHENTPYTTDSKSQVTIPEFIDFMIKSPHHVIYRIEHRQYGFIGHVSINKIDYSRMSCWLGYHIGDKKMWGKSIGTQAVESIMNYLKDKNFKLVYSSSNPENIASVKILEKFFENIGTTEDGLLYFKKTF